MGGGFVGMLRSRFIQFVKRKFASFKSVTTPYIDEGGDGLSVYQRTSGNTQAVTSDGRVVRPGYHDDDDEVAVDVTIAGGIASHNRSRGNKLHKLLHSFKDPKQVQQERRSVKAKNRAQAELSRLQAETEARTASIATRLDCNLLEEDIVFACTLMADNKRSDFFR